MSQNEDSTEHTATRPRSPAARMLHLATSVILLIASAALIVRTISTARQRDSVFAPPAITLIDDKAERDRRQRDVIGTFVTGDTEGDRVIVVEAGGKVQFHPVGPLEIALKQTDSYELGYCDKKICLSTRASGRIDVLDIDRLLYFGDEYRRRQ